MLFKKILLPVDLSGRNQQALTVAADLAQQSKGEVLLLHVVEVIAGLEDEDDFYKRLERVARKRLSQLSDQLAQRPVPSRVEILFGNRAQQIVQHARESGADLMVLTAPRIDANDDPMSLGSLSFKVSIFATCPVLLVK